MGGGTEAGLELSRRYKMKMRKTLLFRLCSCVFSVILIVAGFTFLFIWPVLLKKILQDILVLTPHSHTFDLWKKFPVAFPIDFYFFNWTNPEDVYNDTVKPKFQEIGPYRFWETKAKSNITWNNNGTVTFRHLKIWDFKGEEDNGNILDNITTVNPVALSATYTARNWNYLIRKGLTFSLSAMAPTIHVTRTVSQMLFEGYKDPMITMARSFPILAGNSLPDWDKFGWFYTRNGSETYEGVFNMGTGEGTTFGRLYNWNYQPQTPFYEGNCAKVNGSAGEFFSAPLDKDSISFFSPDLCRTMTLRYVGESLVDNILGNKYVVDSYMLDNGTVFPENKCFCNGQCVPSGLVNVSSCRFGSPSFASLPHFYNADPYYLDSVEGLQPDKNKHEFFLTLEPTTGIPLEVYARIQINLLMQPVSGISMYEKVSKIFFPMLWFEQHVKIPDDEAFKLKLFLNMPTICPALGIFMIVFGFIMCSCLIYKLCTMNLCGKKKRDKYYYREQNIPLRIETQNDLLKKSSQY